MLNELVIVLKSLPWIKVVCYADDLAILAWGPDLQENIEHIQEAIDVIMYWAEAHLLCLSPAKSEVMIFGQLFTLFYVLLQSVFPEIYPDIR